MYDTKRRKGAARFVIKPCDSARAVHLAGDFTNWRPLVMKPQKDGSFAADVAVPAGTYEYKFLVDGKWLADPDNHSWAMNPFGTLNSVARVE